MVQQHNPHRAVMYVRMSTESQDYSTDHQRTKIREYAAACNLTLIREYVDDGKSGLDIRRRPGLTSLMKDVQSAQPDFSHIIVYDISRWGRFQDIDEAAYHEHTCRRAGITVVYCGERFTGDSGPYASLLKSMKRVMAAEYSRDLSEKVFAAQSRFITMGFKQGGHAGYGLRRLALKACGTPRAVLEYGETKVSSTDRVILIWGPDNEIAVVRRVYALYLDEGYSERRIVQLLNSENISSEFGRPWTQAMVNSLLTNVKYCGALAYNRRSSKLSVLRTRNEPTKWIVKSDAVAPIIPKELFDAVQAERARRQRRYTKPELASLLQACYVRHGRVNAKIIAADSTMPDPQLLVRSFGSLVSAYDAAGLPRCASYAFIDTKKKLAAMQADLLERTETLALTAGATVERTANCHTLLLNGAVRVRCDVAVPRNPKRGIRNWRILPRPQTDFTITARMEPATGEIADYFLFSQADLTAKPVYLKASNLDQFAFARHVLLETMFGTREVSKAEEPC